MSLGPSPWRRRLTFVLLGPQRFAQTGEFSGNFHTGNGNNTVSGDDMNSVNEERRRRRRRRTRKKTLVAKKAVSRVPIMNAMGEVVREVVIEEDALESSSGDNSSSNGSSGDDSEYVSTATTNSIMRSSNAVNQEPPPKDLWDHSLWQFRDFIDGIQAAAAEKHYERAAACLESYYKDFFCRQEGDVDEVLVELMEHVEERLKTSIADEAKRALKERDANGIERFAALLSGVGMRDEGLELYRQFPAVLLQREAEENMERLASYLRHVKRQQERLHSLQEREARQRVRDLRLKTLRQERVATLQDMQQRQQQQQSGHQAHHLRRNSQSSENLASSSDSGVGGYGRESDLSSSSGDFGGTGNASQSGGRSSLAEPLTMTIYGADGKPLRTTLAAASNALVTAEERELVEQSAAERRAGEDEAARHAAEDAEDLSQRDALDFVGAVTALYESCATMVEGRRLFVMDNFGEENMDELVVTFFREADRHATRLLRMFMEAMEVQDTLSRAVAHQQLMAEGGAMDPSVDTRVLDPRELTLLLDQMCMLSQCQVLFDKFVAARPNAAAIGHHWAAASRGAGPLVREILQYYNVLEEFFMAESLRKALAIDIPVSRSMLAKLNLNLTTESSSASEITDVPDDSDAETHDAGVVSGVIDNTFFVLKQCCQRALSTMDPTASASVVNLMATTLNLDFRAAMVQALDSYWTGDARHICDPLVVLNNCDLAVEYCARLADRLSRDVRAVFSDDSTAVEKVTLCLSEVQTVALSIQTEILRPRLFDLSEQVRPRVAVLLQRAGPGMCFYTIDEEKFADREVNDPYAHTLRAGVERILGKARESLSTRNFAGLLLFVLRFVASCMEEDLKKREFSLWGGLQLHREITFLRSSFAELLGRSSDAVCLRSIGLSSVGAGANAVDSVFSRLSEMAEIFSAESIDEVAGSIREHCLAGGSSASANQLFAWKLTANEVIKLCSQRIDFSRDAIHRVLAPLADDAPLAFSSSGTGMPMSFPFVTPKKANLSSIDGAATQSGGSPTLLPAQGLYSATASRWWSVGSQIASQYWPPQKTESDHDLQLGISTQDPVDTPPIVQGSVDRSAAFSEENDTVEGQVPLSSRANDFAVVAAPADFSSPTSASFRVSSPPSAHSSPAPLVVANVASPVASTALSSTTSAPTGVTSAASARAAQSSTTFEGVPVWSIDESTPSHAKSALPILQTPYQLMQLDQTQREAALQQEVPATETSSASQSHDRFVI